MSDQPQKWRHADIEERDARIKELEDRLSTALNALRAAKQELEITRHECGSCGRSEPMKEIDLYDQLVHDLAELGDPCDGDHMAPECAHPQCWRRDVEIPIPFSKACHASYATLVKTGVRLYCTQQEGHDGPCSFTLPPE